MKRTSSGSSLKLSCRGFANASIILASLCFVGVESFQQISFAKKRFRSASRKIIRAAVETEEKTKTAATLRFSGERSFTTDSVPKASAAKLYEFFQVDENRNYLVSSGGKKKVEAVESTADLLERWKLEAARMGGDEPATNDIVLNVETGGINFPGLKVVSVAFIGSKLQKASPSSYPEYQFTLITDERSVEGAPPIVWIFNQLTGGGKDDDDSGSKENAAHSFSRVTVGQAGDDLNFSITSILEIGVNFPSLLLKILPVSKEKAEEQGTTAVLKTISKDVEASLIGFKEKYENWISQ